MRSTLAGLMTLLMTSAAMAADASHSEESLFAGTIAQSIAAIIVFCILFVVLYRMAWGPILKGLQDREGKIKHDLEAAEKASKDAAAKLRDLEARLAAAQGEASRILDEARKEAERSARRIQDESTAEITAMKDRATKEIRYAKEQAVNELFAQTATLATEVASKILRRQLNPADQQGLVQESLAAIKREDLN